MALMHEKKNSAQQASALQDIEDQLSSELQNGLGSLKLGPLDGLQLALNDPSEEVQTERAEPAVEMLKHKVRPGDTLSKIAEHYYNDSSHWRTIQAANELTDPNRIRVGDTLLIPSPKTVLGITEPTPEQEQTRKLIARTIEKGDSLWLLSRKLEEPIDLLRELNPNLNERNLRIGDKILVPDRSSYVIQERDNIFNISMELHRSSGLWSAVVRDNNIDPTKLEVGTEVFRRATKGEPDPETVQLIRAFAGRHVPLPLPAENTPQNVKDFITSYAQLATDIERQYGIPSVVTLTQAGIETGWGERVQGNNFFGLKGIGPGGKSQKFWTKEEVNGTKVAVRDRFRAYDSPLESFQDYGREVGSSAFRHIEDPATFMNHVLKSRYATDSHYGELAREILDNNFSFEAGAN